MWVIWFSSDFHLKRNLFFFTSFSFSSFLYLSHHSSVRIPVSFSAIRICSAYIVLYFLPHFVSLTSRASISELKICVIFFNFLTKRHLKIFSLDFLSISTFFLLRTAVCFITLSIVINFEFAELFVRPAAVAGSIAVSLAESFN